MSTPHISAAPGEIAPVVVMPGDPRRAERIAKEYFSSVKCVSDVRGIQAWTGTYGGHPITAMASGMGIPSLSIYATELYRFYGVQRICRVGTCGGVASHINIGDVAIGASAHTNSRAATIYVPDVTLSLAASTDMLIAAVVRAREVTSGTEHKVLTGALFSSDFFYLGRDDVTAGLARLGCLGVEMEAAGLYACALNEGREALAVCTVSDHLTVPQPEMTSAEREMLYSTACEVGLAALLG
ncbi:MAG: DeoD-type purine-nucleoside phosphorylase [Propionibacteriaceae bacterium]|jgi:purine-nucleoside phosphorylase|nr:DeoD-type purine-nucleoside phosphorylase [Propionibacteriaceae bacterium]